MVGPDDDDDDGYFFISHLRFGSFGLLSGKKKRVVVKKKRSHGVLKEAKWLAGWMISWSTAYLTYLLR